MARRGLAVCFTVLFVAETSTGFTQKLFTVEEIFGTDKFKTKTLRGIQWIPDGKAFTYFERDSETGKRTIIQYDLESNKRTVLIASDKMEALEDQRREKRFTVTNYLWSPMGEEIILPSGNDIFLYHIKTETLKRLTQDEARERDPRFSSDGRKIAYLKNHNLYVLDIASGQEIHITDQGTEDLLVGRFDWVYEEEFFIRTGFFWSPDSRHIAYFELDQSRETEFPIVDFVPIHNIATTMRYPKAGDLNGIVRIGIVSAEGGEKIWMDIGEEKDIYIPRIKWLKHGQRLAIQRLNRDQNRLDLFIADAATGKSKKILCEEDTEGWIDINDDLTFLEDGRHFIWSSERSNWKHLYLYDLEGRLVRQITSGEWDVVRLVRVDENQKTVYFIGTEKSSIERHLYRIGLDGKGLQRLTVEEGTHSINMSPDCQYYIDVFSSATTPPRTTLYRSRGQKVRIVESGEIEALKEYELAVPEFFTIQTDHGLELNALLLKPVDFDPGKKYPVLVCTYGGPGSQKVRNKWQRRMEQLWHQMMLQKGCLVFIVDNRGTGFKGNAFKNLVYRNLGKVVIDQINGAKYLRSLPFVDKDRIGIWGWSFGGYTTCMCMLKGSDYFKVGVAVAPVTDWRNYDTIWTERCMDQPCDNEKGYGQSNPINFVDNYKRGLFLIHGSTDDNVHLSNTMQLAYALQNARKPFDMMIYPRRLHSISGKSTRVHLFNIITDFILKNL